METFAWYAKHSRTWFDPRQNPDNRQGSDLQGLGIACLACLACRTAYWDDPFGVTQASPVFLYIETGTVNQTSFDLVIFFTNSPSPFPLLPQRHAPRMHKKAPRINSPIAPPYYTDRLSKLNPNAFLQCLNTKRGTPKSSPCSNLVPFSLFYLPLKNKPLACKLQ